MVTVSPGPNWSMNSKFGSRWKAMITFPAPPAAGLPDQWTMERSYSPLQSPLPATPACLWGGGPRNARGEWAWNEAPPPPHSLIVTGVGVAAGVAVAAGVPGSAALPPSFHAFSALLSL